MKRLKIIANSLQYRFKKTVTIQNLFSITKGILNVPGIKRKNLG